MNIQELQRTPEEKAALLRMAQEATNFLLLSGPNGTGKSFAAKAVYSLVSPYALPAYDHESAIWTNQTDLNAEYIDSFKDDSTANLLKKVKNTKLLVIDDLGTRVPTEAFMDFLYAVVDKRYNDKAFKGTIITTNLGYNEMRAKFGDAFTSRVASGTSLRIDGADRRIHQIVEETTAPIIEGNSPRERCERILRSHPTAFGLSDKMVFLNKWVNGIKYSEPVSLDDPRLLTLLDNTEKKLGIFSTAS